MVIIISYNHQVCSAIHCNQTMSRTSSLKYQIMKVRLLINSKIGLVALMLLSVSFLTAIAQTSNSPITVTTDKPLYSDGSTIIISGTVTDQLNIPISIVIRDSSQNLVYLSQVSPNPDNTYSTQATAGGDLWKTPGTYEIDVTYGGKDKTAKTTFEFTATSTSTGNQTNATEVIPEFGTLAASVFAISTLVVVIWHGRVRHSFKI